MSLPPDIALGESTVHAMPFIRCSQQAKLTHSRRGATLDEETIIQVRKEWQNEVQLRSGCWSGEAQEEGASPALDPSDFSLGMCFITTL